MKENISKKYMLSPLMLIVKGYVISLVLSIILLFIYAVILVNTSVQESTIKPVVIVITCVSILIGSSISSMKIKKNGIVNGLCVGGAYIVTLYLLSSIAISGFEVKMVSLVMIFCGILVGGIGGIIGVNSGRF